MTAAGPVPRRAKVAQSRKRLVWLTIDKKLGLATDRSTCAETKTSRNAQEEVEEERKRGSGGAFARSWDVLETEREREREMLERRIL